MKRKIPFEKIEADKSSYLPPEYIELIKTMARKAKEFGEKFPEKNPKVQFNYSDEIMVIGVIQDARKKGFVTTNDEGEELLHYIGAYVDHRKQPSVFMVKMALEGLAEGLPL